MNSELDLSTYTESCYWEFLQLLHHPLWSVMGNLAHEAKCCGVQLLHQEMAKDKQDEQLLKIWLDMACDDFIQKIVKHHFPVFMPAVEELWGGAVLPYPPPPLWLTKFIQSAVYPLTLVSRSNP